jgi:hypothetical protein
MKLLKYNELKPNTFYFMYPSHNLENVTVIETESDGSFYMLANESAYQPDDAAGNIFEEIDGPRKLTQDDLVKFQDGYVPIDHDAVLAWHRFHELNDNSKFPYKVEGYWRSMAVIPPKDDLPGANMRHYVNMQGAEFPWPVPVTPTGFDQDAFLIKLMALESTLKPLRYRGISRNRLTGESNGCAEYEYADWKWPEGYKEYIKNGVPPSRAFYNFVMGEDLDTLPTYGRD